MSLKIHFVSLGCDKNLVDSEMMLGMLSEEGMVITDDEDAADVVVVNTCCFINDAKEESVETLLYFGKKRTAGTLKGLVACGCLAQRYSEEICKEIPEVDCIVGTTAFDKIVEAVRLAAKEKPESNKGGSDAASNDGAFLDSIDAPPITGKKRLLSTGGHFAYLKIAEGCEKNCTYCVIPKVRGKYRSVPIENLIAEAEGLVRAGVQELILVAQETTLYGVDLYGKKCLPDLLHALASLEELRWIRILYCYPEEIDDELIATMKREKKVCHYLDIPIQHASDAVLKRMGRRTTQSDIRSIVEKLRGEIPDIALRTTLITGFPGETQADFEELYRFVNEMEFDRLGAFSYSCEEDTPASRMPEQVPEAIRDDRRDEIMELQQVISYENSQKRVGNEYECVIEGFDTENEVYVGRTYMDAPGVDGYVFIRSNQNLMSGDFVRVKITEFSAYDLIGELV